MSSLFLFFQVQTIIPRIVLGKGQIVSDNTRDKNVRENLRCEIKYPSLYLYLEVATFVPTVFSECQKTVT